MKHIKHWVEMKTMRKAKLIIEIIVDEDDAEELAYDFRKLYWSHRVFLYSYKSKTEIIPVSHCTYCKTPMFERTSNNLCHDPVCTRLRQDDFNNKKRIQVDRWKEMMCNQCEEDPETDFCYRGDTLVNGNTICKGCIYDTTHPE